MAENISVSPRYFITGTDTGVGKTLATHALMLAWQERGVRCLPVKPVQTGWSEREDDLARNLAGSSLALTDEEREALWMYRYPLPASPHLAAEAAGERIQLATMLDALDALSRRWEMLLIEGAGGLLVPLNDSETMLDLIVASRARPILVTRSGLGTLNHTALTLRELDRAGLAPAGVVINDGAEVTGATAQRIREDNIRVITRLAFPAPVVAIPHLRETTPEHLIPWGRLLVSHLSA